MVFRNWSEPDDYLFCRDLTAAQWAWEFLRRNPDYQAEWRAFDQTWRALEAAYGRPPDRDFCAWKQDPRAWVSTTDCRDGDCRVDRDKVLIECALGARWGFYKFPPDPGDDDPVGGERLAWREIEQTVPLLGADDTDWLGNDPARVALGFDLALPLRDQVERAKRLLQLLQRQRRRSGRLLPRTVAALRDDWVVMLRLLDAEADAAPDIVITQVLGRDVEALRAPARALRDGGYRALPMVPA